VGQIVCLTVDLKKTKKLLKSKKKEFIFYKVFRNKDGELFSFLRYAGVDHAHLTKKRAIYAVAGRPFLNAVIILPIHVKKEHIVAVGNNGDVCFTQYEIKNLLINKR